MARRTKQLQDWDQKYLWHPFTPMQDWLARPPLIIERGKGSYLIDTEGKRYLDGVSSLWVNVHGHNHPVLQKALRKQIDKIAHSTLLGLANVPAVELARKLVDLAPKGLEKVFYSDNGSTAVEVALKMAFQYWQQRQPDKTVSAPKEKVRFMTLDQAYHGDTIGSVSVGGMELFHQIYHPLLFDTIKIPNPQVLARKHKMPLEEAGKICLGFTLKLMDMHRNDVAALIVEPRMQGAAGMFKMPQGYLATLRDLCKQSQILLIVDEVATGFGRTGKMFACEHENVSPDFLCLAKGISGGTLPLAATLTREEIYQGFMGEAQEFKTFFHGHTYTGNPLACAVALANLSLFERKGFWPELSKKIRFLTDELESLKELSFVGEIRQEGVMVGIELVKNKETLEAFDYSEQMGHRVCYAARPKGLIIRPLGNVLVLMPPLSMTKVELRKMVTIVRESIQVTTEI